MPHNYTNPRIDRPNQQANAYQGRIRLSLSKTIWVSAMALAGSIGSLLTFSWGAFALFIISTWVTLCIGHSLGRHRRFIHRSFSCPRWLELLLIHFGTLVGIAGPLGMLHTHDVRDWAQRQARCHPMFSQNSVWYRDLCWQVFCTIDLDAPPRLEPEAEIANDNVIKWMEKTWMLQQLPWAVLFYAIGGWGWVCWGICSRVSVSLIGHWLIGFFAHNEDFNSHKLRDWHIRDVAVQGHNVSWTSLLAMGENWHNNHHAFPYSAQMGLEPGQWDPGWWVLNGLARLGLAYDLVLPERTVLRKELIRLSH
ncbi:acyl-CoA desaturase [Arenicella xantha]|uniref:Stearoyl-CoA desaturase (Delta-9 desaturase) n=1 Tax=Arenicella xantha TaxID=644221 RepID=A0A395JQB5_9GAMM|nr:acyl-CoA desaturase [Arenicella xantha]RBP53809.1 stearoyl-CoA desaturase (delta-9 desaturase) [Arenicella xantha]